MARKKPKGWRGDSKRHSKAAKLGHARSRRHPDSQHWLYGESNVPRDKMRKAKKPGKRTSSSGKHYYEHRANRSDRHKYL